MLSGHKRKRGHDDSQLSQANGKHGAGSVTPESDERRHNPAKAARTHTTAGISDRRNESGQGAPTPATNGKPSTVPTRGESDSGTASAQEAAGQKQVGLRSPFVYHCCTSPSRLIVFVAVSSVRVVLHVSPSDLSGSMAGSSNRVGVPCCEQRWE